MHENGRCRPTSGIEPQRRTSIKLFASGTSPYARKVRVALIELGLESRVSVIPAAPLETPSLRDINPLGKVPALVLDDGRVLYDSLVILDHLDQISGEASLIPANPADRTEELRRHALANGMLDAAFSIFTELRRPEENRSEFWIGRWSETIEVAARAVASEAPDGTPLTLSTLTAAIAVDYVAFRLAPLKLTLGGLTAWRERYADRPSLLQTAPELELA